MNLEVRLCRRWGVWPQERCSTQMFWAREEVNQRDTMCVWIFEVVFQARIWWERIVFKRQLWSIRDSLVTGPWSQNQQCRGTTQMRTAAIDPETDSRYNCSSSALPATSYLRIAMNGTISLLRIESNDIRRWCVVSWGFNVQMGSLVANWGRSCSFKFPNRGWPPFIVLRREWMLDHHVPD